MPAQGVGGTVQIDNVKRSLSTMVANTRQQQNFLCSEHTVKTLPCYWRTVMLVFEEQFSWSSSDAFLGRVVHLMDILYDFSLALWPLDMRGKLTPWQSTWIS